ncbi:hypothetical protein [Rhizobium sp. Root483D2]|uniref:hypothetical protein n=1 Tax=Rhizobium sp. Root483D2 TaxID=1736545 RepID=UPI000712AE02|nr:hypothetical protein [Rhizobium sp. Root483D2]KQY21020.1 hypothetical protein ASD32_06475 [Rhizobium sp. Root483D2]
MDIEEHGRFYIERKTIGDADGGVTAFFDVGEISTATGTKRYKVAMDEGFSSRQEALAWIEKQTD